MQSRSPSALTLTSKYNSADPMEVDQNEYDPLNKLREQEIIPELFGLLHEVESGKLLAKDFINNSGNIRLKINYLKKYLKEIEGITQTTDFRKERIELLEANNKKKLQLLNDFKDNVEKKFHD